MSVGLWGFEFNGVVVKNQLRENKRVQNSFSEQGDLLFFYNIFLQKMKAISNYRHSSIYTVNLRSDKKTAESKNRVNQGYLVVLKGRKIG